MVPEDEPVTRRNFRWKQSNKVFIIQSVINLIEVTKWSHDTQFRRVIFLQLICSSCHLSFQTCTESMPAFTSAMLFCWAFLFFGTKVGFSSFAHDVYTTDQSECLLCSLLPRHIQNIQHAGPLVSKNPLLYNTKHESERSVSFYKYKSRLKTIVTALLTFKAAVGNFPVSLIYFFVFYLEKMS